MKVDFIRYFNKPLNNILLLFIGMVLAVIIGSSADLHQSTGHGGLIPLIYPPVVTIFTVILYLVSRIFTRKFNWIIVLFSITYMIVDAIFFYVNNDIG